MTPPDDRPDTSDGWPAAPAPEAPRLDLRALVHDGAGHAARTACAMAEVEAAFKALEAAVQAHLHAGRDPLPTSVPPVSGHRRAHRPGLPRRTCADPELAAFIRARIDRMTVEDLAEAVAAHFPPARRVRKSATHAWWKAQTRR